ncbi:MAG TPA: YciI family protein [Kribbella sp.]|nr:YciI family protein [Kribbella sp.]
MKYLVLIFSNADTTRTGSEEDLRGLFALRDELAGTGELVSAEGLSLPQAGKVVRVREGAKVITDGPFGEAKEQIAGYFLIDCLDDERADEIAGRVSAVIDDRVEVRGVLLSA